MLLVIDTNILVNAIKSSDPNSKAAMLMRDVFNGVHKMCVSPDILDEYEDEPMKLNTNAADRDACLFFCRNAY